MSDRHRVIKSAIFDRPLSLGKKLHKKPIPAKEQRARLPDTTADPEYEVSNMLVHAQMLQWPVTTELSALSVEVDLPTTDLAVGLSTRLRAHETILQIIKPAR
jgi:hypothetical protein